MLARAPVQADTGSETAATKRLSVTGLELRGIRKSYGSRTVCHETSFSVPFGAFVCFLGPSGCGKTTLLRMIAGLAAPSSGRVLMGGKDITDQPTHTRNFGMVFQSLALFPHLSVSDNITYALRLRGVPRGERQARTDELLRLIRLPDAGRRRVSDLSGGQRQRVAIARALAQEPALFLLDEPLSALDARLRDHMQVELKQLQQKLQVTTILVTHDQREAMTIADLIVVMADGRVQQIGTPLEIYRKPANRFVAGFIGQNNLLDVERLDAEHVRFRDAVLDVAPPAVEAERLTLSIRPEHVHVGNSPADRPADPAHATPLPGHIEFVRDLGASVELHVACVGQSLICAADPARIAQHPHIGDPVWLSLRRAGCVLHTA